MKGRPEKIVWLYEKSHVKQPVVKQAIATLCEAGHDLTLVNMLNENLEGEAYHHVSMQLLFKRHKILRVVLNKLLIREYGAYKFGIAMPLTWIAYCLKHKPNIVMASMPLGLLAGWILKMIIGCRLVYYPMELYGEQKSNSSRILSWIEHKLVKSLDSLITQNDARGRVYVEEYGLPFKPQVVHNYKPDPGPRKGGLLQERLTLPESAKIVLYEGIIYPGRWIDRLIKAVPLLPDDVVLVLLGPIDNRGGWWDNTMVPLIRVLGVEERFFSVPWVKPVKLPRYIKDAHVGVIIYDDSVRNNLFCEPGKLSDYVLSGLPVIAPHYETIGPKVQRLGIGEVFESGSPENIATAIMRVLNTPPEVYAANLEKASAEVVWSTQESKLLEGVLGELYEAKGD